MYAKNKKYPTFSEMEAVVMLYTYNQCIEIWNTNYRINQLIQNNQLYQIEKGIYSDTPRVSSLAIISTKYPKAIITMDTAFYYHDLTDVIPDEYYIATSKSSRRLGDKRIRQMFVKDEILNIGVVTMERRDATFRIYDKERMLIELLRFKTKLPYDYYKEILNNYRNIIYELDIERIQKYSQIFPKHRMISEALDKEVF